MIYRYIIIAALALISCKNNENTDTTETQTEHTRTQTTRVTRTSTSGNTTTQSTSTTSVTVNENPNINISILLDLSDRIDPNKNPNPAMDYFERDAAYIKMVADAFENHVKKKRVIQVKDKIQLFFHPEPKNHQINTIASELKFSLNKSNISKDALTKLDAAYSTKPKKIYEHAIIDGNLSNGYPGSNIWSFFKNNINDNCINPDYRNILVILTDGYIYHEDMKINEENMTTYLTPLFIKNNGLNTSKWKEKMEQGHYGFLPANDELSNIEILVIGINPSKNSPYEEDVIKAYWENWFKSMNVQRYDIKRADLPTNMETVINNFI